MKKLVFPLIAFLIPALMAQDATAGAEKMIPQDVLYRFLFQQVAAADDLATKMTESKSSGAADLRSLYETMLHLTPAEAATLKKVAAGCNQDVERQDSKAQTTIANLKAARRGLPDPAPQSLPPEIKQLEQERTDIANGCIQSLRAGVGERTFTNIDIYVRTVLGSRATVTGVPIVIPKAPLSASGTSPSGTPPSSTPQEVSK